MKRQPWTTEDRQRFADGDVLRASTVRAGRGSSGGPAGKVPHGRRAGVVDDFAAAMDELDDELLACGVENPEVCESCT